MGTENDFRLRCNCIRIGLSLTPVSVCESGCSVKHGPFDAEAWHFSPQLWANKNRNWLLAGLGVIGAACAFAAARGRNGNERRSVFAMSQVSG